MPGRRYLIIKILILLFLYGGRVIAQEQQIMVDTSGYIPLPDGLNYNLAVAASNGYAFEIHRLIKLGADPDIPDLIGATPLIYAVANNRKDAVAALLSHDPDLNFFTNLGESPIHIAAKYDFLEIGEQIIRKGANVDLKDGYGCTPLHYSSIYDYFYFTDMLIYYNASVNTRSADGTTPLLASVWAGNAEIADLLLQSGANPDISDNNGFTPLMAAAQNGDTIIADLLSRYDADIYAVNYYSYNALAVAIRSNQYIMVEFLLRKMKILNSPTGKAADPFEVARSYGRKEIVKLLGSYGLEESIKLNFDHVTFSASTLVNWYDIYTGGSIGFSDPFYKIRIFAGFNMKPTYTRVLVKENDNLYIQYLDKRYVVYAGAAKGFRLTENYRKGNLDFEINLSAGYMFCNQYRGTYIKPENRFLLTPSAVLSWSKKRVNIFMGYEYMQTGLYKAGPNWIKAGVSANIYFNRSRAPLKDIKWY